MSGKHSLTLVTWPVIVVVVVGEIAWRQLTDTDCAGVPVTVLNAFPVLHGHITL